MCHFEPANRLAWVFGYGYTVSERTDIFLVAGTEHAQKDMVVIYGVEFFHFYRKQHLVQPFFGYGLIFSQLLNKELKGREAGHYTKLKFGVALKGRKGNKWLISCSYVITNYPSFDREAINLNLLNFSIGRYWGL